MEFVRYICEILDIEEPEISFDVSMFPSETTLAMANVSTRTLHLREQAVKVIEDREGDVDVSLCFTISHELRHIWQSDSDFEYWFHNYSDDSSDVDAYNTQRAEVDANAFGDMVCIALTGCEIIFGDLAPDVCRMIRDRRRELEKIYTDK